MKKLLKWLGLGIVVIIIVGVVASLGKSGDNKTPSSNNAEQKQEQEQRQVQEPTKITAQELAADFDANQVAAETKWKGKLVEFSAVITNITDSGLSFSKVGSDEFSLTQISCRVVDKQQLLSLKNGQTATVRGIVGSQTLGVIDVNDCKVI